MEGGCYERCYENVLNLHMLRDIEEWANSLIFNQSPGSQSLTLIDKNMEVILFNIYRAFSQMIITIVLNTFGKLFAD